MTPRRLLALVLASVSSALVLAGCGSSDATELVFCSDTTYPPMEYIENGQPVGADVDIARAVADNLGREAIIETTGFDVIIPALQQEKCDAIISALSNTPERRKEVDFVDYVTVGTLIMVKAGNPAGVSDIASLSGKDVAVQAATTQKAMLEAKSAEFEAAGKPGINISVFPADTNAAAALSNDRVDAYVADATPVLYYIKQTGDEFEVVGEQLDTTPEGIATRKGDELGQEIQEAVDELYADGTIPDILEKWGLSEFALQK